MEQSKTIYVSQPLADYISEKDYGTIIHYQEIERITNQRKGTSAYYRHISNAKILLEKKGKAITPVGGGDYQVLYPGDYTAAYVRQVKLANKRIKRGGKILEGAPVNDMSDEERQTYNNVLDFHKRLDAQFNGNYVEVKRLSDRKHPLLPDT